MKILLNDAEVERELAKHDISKLSSDDKSQTKVIGPGSTLEDHRGKAVNNLTREMAAIDSLTIGQKKSSIIHELNHNTVSDATRGEISDRVDSDLKAAVDNQRYKIKDMAVSKLMNTLDLFRPDALENQMEVVTAASKLSKIVVDLEAKDNKDKGPQVQVILFNPRQNTEAKYDVIEA